MARSIKLTFNRTSEFKAKNFVVVKNMTTNAFEERAVKSVEYKSNGRVTINGDGFEINVDGVDRLFCIIKPLDDFFAKVSFEIKKNDGSKTKIPIYFYGIRGTNILIDYKEETGGYGDDLPDDVK